jgi:hypothetical protein
MANTDRGRKPIQRGAGRRKVDGKNFLADEVRYILRRAADHDGRIVTIGQLVLFSTETGDAWLLDPSDQLAARLARDGDSESFHIEETIIPSRLTGRATIASRDQRSFTWIEKPDGSPPSTDIQHTN